MVRGPVAPVFEAHAGRVPPVYIITAERFWRQQIRVPRTVGYRTIRLPCVYDNDQTNYCGIKSVGRDNMKSIYVMDDWLFAVMQAKFFAGKTTTLSPNPAETYPARIPDEGILLICSARSVPIYILAMIPRAYVKQKPSCSGP